MGSKSIRKIAVAILPPSRGMFWYRGRVASGYRAPMAYVIARSMNSAKRNVIPERMPPNLQPTVPTRKITQRGSWL
ncbi:MAG: hypothetical protein H5T34_00290 [Candidatus Methanomethyliales bacterium]|nr:hypothetical protein [Candidatus Methanomethylicales archaeon]